MKNLLLLLLCCAQQLTAQSVQLLGDIGDFTTQGGKTIPHCKLGYRTVGQLNRDKSNVVLWPTWFTGTSAQIEQWSLNGSLDTTGLYVIMLDALGNGVSSSPSNTKNFPAITIRDMVNAEHELLTKVLNINHVYAVMGVSMGGMQTFEWLVSYPDFMEKAIPIVGTPKLSSVDIMLWQSEAEMLQRAGKSKKAQADALREVANIHMMHLYTPDYWVRSQEPDKTQAALQENQKGTLEGNNPANWLCQLEAMMAQDIYKNSGKTPEQLKSVLKAKILVIVARQDQMVNPHTATLFAQTLQTKFLQLEGDCGHLATGCEGEIVKKTIVSFLKK